MPGIIITTDVELCVGDIVYVEMDSNDGLVLNEGYPTRLKYVVVAGSKSDNKEACLVLINSDNDYSDDPEWIAAQIPIAHNNYPEILDYDSWMDCTDPKQMTMRKLRARKAEIVGRLNDEDLSLVMATLKDSGFIDTHLKKVYGILSYGTAEN